MNIIEFFRKMISRQTSNDIAEPLPRAKQKNPTYENFYAQCPTCNRRNVFNRASDIGNFELIANVTVRCEHSDCRQVFTIGGDWINPSWQMLILDCEDLKTQKLYTYCILNLAQSFEMFFALFLRVHFLYKPYACENPGELDRFNKCSALLYHTTRKYAYSKMHNLFVNLILIGVEFNTIAESMAEIARLPSLTNEPSEVAIQAIHDLEMSDLLLRLKKCNVPDLRNDVIHKEGYRPSLQEVEKALEETGTILHKLNRLLGQPTDNLYFYCANTSAT